MKTWSNFGVKQLLRPFLTSFRNRLQIAIAGLFAMLKQLEISILWHRTSCSIFFGVTVKTV